MVMLAKYIRYWYVSSQKNLTIWCFIRIDLSIYLIIFIDKIILSYLWCFTSFDWLFFHWFFFSCSACSNYLCTCKNGLAGSYIENIILRVVFILTMIIKLFELYKENVIQLNILFDFVIKMSVFQSVKKELTTYAWGHVPQSPLQL